MSMNPGATTCPVPSRVRSPSRPSPISVMRSPVTATSAFRPGAPEPSTTVPPRMIRSALMVSALSTGQVCPDSGVVGQVDQAAGPVGRRLVGEEPRPEAVLVPVLGGVEPDSAPTRRLDEQEVDALGLTAGGVLEIVGGHVLATAGAMRAGGGIAVGVDDGKVRVHPAVGDDRLVARRRRGHVEVAGQDADRLAVATRPSAHRSARRTSRSPIAFAWFVWQSESVMSAGHSGGHSAG